MKNLFTVVIAGSQYLLHPQKLGTIEETINPDALIPVTLLTTSEINNDLEGILDLFATVDDVFQPDFGGILVEKPEKGKSIGLTQNPSPRSRALFSLQEAEAEVLGFEDLPSGPYFLHGPNLYQAWRLYDDVLDAFTFGVIPNSINGTDDGYEALSSLSDNGSFRSIAVPSRLYHAAPSIRKPLSGVRISITDAVSLKGVRTTLSSRSWTQLYDAEVTETAEFAQRLIDMGAIIVGKTKSSQLDSGREWADVEAPWNPRGDGYQTAGGSAAGAGASVSGYEWMEYAVAQDGFDGVRDQARVHGIYSIRSSAEALPLDGWRVGSHNYAAIGLLSRSIHDLLRIAQVTSNATDVNVKFPKRIVYPLDFASISKDHHALDDKFVATLEHLLGVRADKVLLSEIWDAKPPSQANGQSLEEYMKQAPFSSFCSDFYHGYEDFRNSYKNKFGREPYVEATPRFRWAIGESESKEDYKDHRERIKVFQRWFDDHVMSTHEDSDSIMILPFGPHTVQYRDDLLQTPSRIDGIGPEALAPLLGLPHLVVPFTQTPYHSRITDGIENRPFSSSIMGPDGSDIMLVQLAKAAFEGAKWRSQVDTGRLAFPEDYNPE
ncbi:amidase signature domain-containing protein [Trichoderma ceciliae]